MQYLTGELATEEFIQTRAGVLAKINADEMDPKDALALLKELLDAGLISPTEYDRKRGEMLAAL